jgi:hypothetical protein
MPDRQSQLASGLEHSQHFANTVNRRGKEHHTEAADHGIERTRWERQRVCGGDFELCIAELETVCRPTGGVNHFLRGIDPEDLARGADPGSYGQRRLSGARSDIQNCLASADQRLLNQSLRNWRKHLPDDFAVLLPEGRGITPCAYNLLVGLHQQKYTYPAIDV